MNGIKSKKPQNEAVPPIVTLIDALIFRAQAESRNPRATLENRKAGLAVEERLIQWRSEEISKIESGEAVLAA